MARIDYSAIGDDALRRKREGIQKRKYGSLRKDCTIQEAETLSHASIESAPARREYRRIRAMRKNDIIEVAERHGLNPKDDDDRKEIVKYIRDVRSLFRFLPTRAKDFFDEEYERQIRGRGRIRDVIGHTDFYDYYDEYAVRSAISKGLVRDIREYARRR